MRSSADPRVSRPLSPACRVPACRIAVLRPCIEIRTQYAWRPRSDLGLATYLCPLLTSGEASGCLSTPVARRHRARSPRVLSSHFHTCVCRIYAPAFRASTGLRGMWPAHLAGSPLIRFLFVRPALCHPAPFKPAAPRNPCRACRGLSPPSRCALPGGPTKKRAPKRPQMQPHSLAFEG